MTFSAALAEAHQKLMLDSRGIRAAVRVTLERSQAKVDALRNEIETSRNRRAHSRDNRWRLAATPSAVRGARLRQARDPRWILLTEEGEHATLAWRRDLDDEHIAAAEMALAQMDRAGWLAVMSDAVDTDADLEIIMVRPLRNPAKPFEEAIAALEHARF